MSQSITTREYASAILRALQVDSEYAWYDAETEPRLSANIKKSIGYGDLVSRHLFGELQTSDCFILQAVMSLGFCTAGMVREMLAFIKSGHDKQNCIVPGMPELVSRLKALSRLSLVYIFEYYYDGTKHLMYSVTIMGIQYWNHASMKKNKNMDVMMNTIPPIDMMRCLGASYVALKYASMLGTSVCREIKSNDTINLGGGYGKQTVYSRLYCKTDDTSRYLIYIEPAYANYDERRFTDAENSQMIITRLKELRRHMAFNLNSKERDPEGNETSVLSYKGVQLILVVENKAALDKVVSLLYREMPDLLSSVWFTSCSVLQYTRDVAHSFFVVKVGDDADGQISYKIGIAKHEDLLKCQDASVELKEN